MLNVKDFGAIGNGIDDDTDAINKAFAAVRTQKKSLYFPGGTYRCDKLDVDRHVLALNGGGLNNITIMGDGATSHITTSVSSASTLLYVWAYAKNTNLKITGLKFSSTHAPATQFYQDAIFIQGTAGSNFENVAITLNEFSGFGNTIGTQGIAGLNIDRNRFLSPRGHDDSQNNTKPAVFVWLHDNANGYNRSVTITNNFASGYTGTAPIGSLVTKRAMDGFVIARVYGMTISGNTTENFSEEHYIVGEPYTFPDTTAPVLISNNDMNGAIPIGSYAQDGSRKISNYGIRSDASYVTMEKNVMRNITLGILVRTIDLPTLNSKSINILNNTIICATDAANYAVRSGVYVVGGVGNPVKDLRIEGNKIYSSIKTPGNYEAVIIANVNGTTVINNLIDQTVNAGSSAAVGTAFAYKKSFNVIHRDNTVTGPLIPLSGLLLN